MKRNVGGIDRVVRLLVGVFLIGFGLGAIRGRPVSLWPWRDWSL